MGGTLGYSTNSGQAPVQLPFSGGAMGTMFVAKKKPKKSVRGVKSDEKAVNNVQKNQKIKVFLEKMRHRKYEKLHEQRNIGLSNSDQGPYEDGNKDQEL